MIWIARLACYAHDSVFHVRANHKLDRRGGYIPTMCIMVMNVQWIEKRENGIDIG